MTTTTQTAARRTTRSPSDRPRHRPRRPLNMARRRIPPPPPMDASEALHLIMADGDVYLVGRQRYLVAPITQDTLDALIVANSLAEDDEPNGDLEPSLGTEDDLEGDGLDFVIQGFTAVGESDDSWPNEGSHLHLHGGRCDSVDDEDGDPSGDVLDRGELDTCDDEPSCQRADLFPGSTR